MASELGTWIDRAAEGEAEATSAVLEVCYERLPAITARRLGALVRGREATLDVVQSVCREFLAAAPPAVRHDREQAIRWLAKAVEHKIVAKYRYYTAAKRDVRAEVEARLGAEGPEAPEPAAEDFDPARELEDEAARRRYERLLATLDDRPRRVLELRAAGRAPKDIARELGCPEGTVRSDLARARKRLTELLGGG